MMVDNLTQEPGVPSRITRTPLVEDMVPLFGVPVLLRVLRKIRKAVLAPSGQPFPITRFGGVVKEFVLEVRCHQAVVFDY